MKLAINTHKTSHQLALLSIFLTAWLLLILRYVGGNPETSWPTSDAVIFSLMAMHMLEGEAFNWYFYGQDYMGTFPVLIIMLLFKYMGISHLWVELLIAAIYAASLTLLSAFVIRRVGYLATWSVAVLFCLFPTEQDVLAALDSGTHNFSILTGLLCSYGFCLLLEQRLCAKQKSNWYLVLGWVAVLLLAILTYWSSKLGMAYIIPVVGLALISVRKQLGWVKFLPFSNHGLDNFWQHYSRWVWVGIGSMAFVVLLLLEKGLFNLQLIIEIYFLYLFDKIESPWNIIWPSITVLGMAGIIWYERKTLISMLQGNETQIPWHILVVSIPLFNILIALPTTEHLDDFTSARYFESFQWASLIAIPLLGTLIFQASWRRLFSITYLVFAIFTWYSPDEEDYDRISHPLKTLQFIADRKADISRLTQDEKAAIEFLQQRGLYYGYGDYWLAYRLSYLTHEKVLISPYIESRYEAYDKKIERHGAGFFLFNIYELADGREYAHRYGVFKEKVFGELILFY